MYTQVVFIKMLLKLKF